MNSNSLKCNEISKSGSNNILNKVIKSEDFSYDCYLNSSSQVRFFK